MKIDPLSQFNLKTLIPIKFSLGAINVDISFTNASLFMVLVPLLTLAISKAAFKRDDIVPSRSMAFVEMMFSFLDDLIKEHLGEEGVRYTPLIVAVFVFIFLANIMGIIPGSYSVTSQIIVNFCLALIVFITANIVGIIKNGLHFFRIFCPTGTPVYIAPLFIVVEFATYFIRPISLSIRLFANMVAGHVILDLFSSFAAADIDIPLLGGFVSLISTITNVGLFAFEVLVALLQAYVFTVLTCIYFKDTLESH